MPPRRVPVDDDEEADDVEEAAPRPPPPRRSRGRATTRPAVRRWTDEEEPPEDEAPARRGAPHASPEKARPPAKERVYFRARDSVYFEPLVALAVIVVLLVGMFAYTQNWPPMYVVESDSMQHGYNDQVGLINTGDLVLAQKVSQSQITPYVVGAQSGYTTYGEYGDVILYHPNGDPAGAPIIHRALLFITVNANQTYSFPELQGQPCGQVANPVYSVSTPLAPCETSWVPESSTLTLYHIGWRSVDVVVTLGSLGTNSGFLTMGDNNFNPEDTSQGNPDQPFLSSLVEPAWVVGVARGMLPWFGSVKLLLDGNSGEVPSQSWTYMGLTIIGIIGAAILLHLFLRAEGIEDERRKAREAAEREARGDHETSEVEVSRRSWRHPLRGWSQRDEEEATDSHRSKPEAPPTEERRTTFGGRPRPEVGRSPPTSKRKHSPADNDDENL